MQFIRRSIFLAGGALLAGPAIMHPALAQTAPAPQAQAPGLLDLPEYRYNILRPIQKFPQRTKQSQFWQKKLFSPLREWC